MVARTLHAGHDRGQRREARRRLTGQQAGQLSCPCPAAPTGAATTSGRGGRRSGPCSPTRGAWPTNSSSVRGRIRAASGCRSGGGWNRASGRAPVVRRGEWHARRKRGFSGFLSPREVRRPPRGLDSRTTKGCSTTARSAAATRVQRGDIRLGRPEAAHAAWPVATARSGRRAPWSRPLPGWPRQRRPPSSSAAPGLLLIGQRVEAVLPGRRRRPAGSRAASTPARWRRWAPSRSGRRRLGPAWRWSAEGLQRGSGPAAGADGCRAAGRAADWKRKTPSCSTRRTGRREMDRPPAGGPSIINAPVHRTRALLVALFNRGSLVLLVLSGGGSPDVPRSAPGRPDPRRWWYSPRRPRCTPGQGLRRPARELDERPPLTVRSRRPRRRVPAGRVRPVQPVRAGDRRAKLCARPARRGSRRLGAGRALRPVRDPDSRPRPSSAVADASLGRGSAAMVRRWPAASRWRTAMLPTASTYGRPAVHRRLHPFRGDASHPPRRCRVGPSWCRRRQLTVGRATPSGLEALLGV